MEWDRIEIMKLVERQPFNQQSLPKRALGPMAVTGLYSAMAKYNVPPCYYVASENVARYMKTQEWWTELSDDVPFGNLHRMGLIGVMYGLEVLSDVYISLRPTMRCLSDNVLALVADEKYLPGNLHVNVIKLEITE